MGQEGAVKGKGESNKTEIKDKADPASAWLQAASCWVNPMSLVSSSSIPVGRELWGCTLGVYTGTGCGK